MKYGSFLIRSTWPINGALNSIANPGQSGPGSNGNEGVHESPQISRTGASPSDVV